MDNAQVTGTNTSLESQDTNRQRKKRNRSLLILPLAVALITFFVCVCSWMATIGLLPHRVSESGQSRLAADYRRWEGYSSLALDVQGLATAAAQGAQPWWPTPVSGSVSQPTETAEPTAVSPPSGTPIVRSPTVTPSQTPTPTRMPTRLPRTVTPSITPTATISPTPTATLSPAPPSAELSLRLVDAPDPVTVGINVTYTLTITNNGPDTSTGVSLTSTLSPGVALVSVTSTQGSCAGAGTSVTCSLGSINSGSSVTVTIVVRPTAAGVINCVASVSASTPDPNSGNNAASASTTVNVGNSPPVAANDAASTPEDTAIVIDVVANDTDVDGNLDPTTVTVTITPSQGTIAGINPATGEITYQPDPDFNGTDSFTYRVCDTGGLCDTATVTVTVTPVNDAPVANDDAATTNEDTSVPIAVLANDTDVDGNLDPTTLSVIAWPTDGSLVLNPVTHVITYFPNADFNGGDSFTYQVCDLVGACDVAVVTLTVTAIDDAPVANDDSTTTPEDTAVTVDVVANDTDVDGNLDPTSVSVVAGPSNGAITSINPATGEITYQPNLNFNGSDSFTYQVCDTTALCDTAVVDVTVGVVNDAPVANDYTATTNEDTAVTVDVVANDTDVDGNLDPTSVSIVAGPSNGAITSINPATGEITYQPNLNFNGSDSFTYQVCDTGGLCDTATVTVTVTPVNDAPVANNDAATTNEDTAVTVDVVANDTDVDGNLDPTSVSIVAGPSNGAITSINPATGEVTYQPNLNFNGSDSFTYQVCDTGGLCDTATVTVTVTPVNDAPVANDDTATTAEDNAVTVNVLANDTDIEGNINPASVTVVAGPSNGAITSINPATGEITYQPNLNFNGSDSFTYQVCDTGGLCDTATVTVTVTPVNDAPVANDDTAVVVQDTLTDIDVVANDTDIDGNLNSASVTIVAGPSNGTISAILPTGVVQYNPNAGYAGNDSFTYQVCDTGGLCDTAVVSIIVTLVGEPDIGPPDGPYLNMFCGEQYVISLGGNTIVTHPGYDLVYYEYFNGIEVVMNSIIVEVGTSAFGPWHQVFYWGDGILDANTNIGAAGYGSSGEPDTQSIPSTHPPLYGYAPLITGVAIDVDAVAPAGTYSWVRLTVPTTNCSDSEVDALQPLHMPVANDDTATTLHDTPVIIDVLANDTDADSDIEPNTVTVTSGPANGSTSVNPATGAITYTPSPGYTGPDTFTYQVCDMGMSCDTATVSITVTIVSLPAPKVLYTRNEGSAIAAGEDLPGAPLNLAVARSRFWPDWLHKASYPLGALADAGQCKPLSAGLRS